MSANVPETRLPIDVCLKKRLLAAGYALRSWAMNPPHRSPVYGVLADKPGMRGFYHATGSTPRAALKALVEQMERMGALKSETFVPSSGTS